MRGSKDRLSGSTPQVVISNRGKLIQFRSPNQKIARERKEEENENEEEEEEEEREREREVELEKKEKVSSEEIAVPGNGAKKLGHTKVYRLLKPKCDT